MGLLRRLRLEERHARVAVIGVFGGSGFSELLDDVTERTVDTPFGSPSGPVHIGSIGDHEVAFLARHGPGHVIPPHRINFRANLWALKALGVTRIFGPCACGSLRAEIAPTHFVV
ncbi:MAG: 5'-methylthioadenosine phosphorylase, partial [Acidimicrobiia bacterium]|nr:5'-methylthioadenosine phosphorylase [Acidimicrobiia bacterium]